MKVVNIVSEQASGLGVDSRILESVLKEAGFGATIGMVRQGRLSSIVDRLIPKVQWYFLPQRAPSVSIFCEQIFQNWLNTSKVNVLIPNQEWCRPATLEMLPHIDKVLCKTRYAETIFKNMGCNTSFVGFTSPDHHQNNVRKNYRKFLHVAGKSLQKGTIPLVKLWSKHPEWPCLTVVTHHPHLIYEYGADNIIVESRISMDRLKFLQNESGLHICPHEAEGFGHIINEALGCGAVIISTNAPPMNELVRPEWGFLVNYSHSLAQSLGTNFYIDETSLFEAVNIILKMEISELERMSMRARDAFVKAKEEFSHRLVEQISEIA